MNTTQSEKVRTGRGFFAALDQSGGSTPKALAEYGVEPDRYSSDAEMFDLVHAMRTRVLTGRAVPSSLTPYRASRFPTSCRHESASPRSSQARRVPE